MRNPFSIFAIRKGERWPALAIFIYLTALNALAVSKYFEAFTRCGHLGYYSLFFGDFTLSGFDPFTYVILSEWRSLYSLARHPLLAVLIYPLNQLNQWLMMLTDMNCAVFIWATVLIVLSLYSFLFLFRILHKIIGIGHKDSFLLSVFFFAFGHIMVTVVAPDHFALSLFCLLLTLYVAGRAIRLKEPLAAWKTALLLFLSTGVTATNGLKVVLAGWFAGGRRFFRPKSFAVSIVLPLLLLGGSYLIISEYIQKPEQERRDRTLNQRLKKDEAFRKQQATLMQAAAKRNANAIMKGESFRWTDLSLSRPRSVIENLFGESLMLHEDHALQDVNKGRPVFVTYRNKMCYVVAGIVMLLLLLGIVTGLHDRFMQLCLSWFSLDMALHLGLGFALSEVYIMAAHWTFVLPIAVGFLLKRLQKPGIKQALRLLTVLITVFMLAINGRIFLNFILE